MPLRQEVMRACGGILGERQRGRTSVTGRRLPGCEWVHNAQSSEMGALKGVPNEPCFCFRAAK